MRADHGAGALAVEVEIAHLEGASGVVEFAAVRGVDRAGETVLGVVRDVERFFVIFYTNDGEHRAKDFFLRDARGGRDIRYDGGLDVVAPVFLDALPAGEDAAFAFADIDVIEDALHRGLIHDGAHVDVLDRIADLDVGHARLDALEECVVDRFFDDGAGAGGTLLSVEAEGRGHDAFDGSVDVRIRADDDRVLAAELEDGALDPDLALLRLRGALVNFEADGFRAGEGDEACLRMFNERAADFWAALAQVHDARRHAGLFEYVEEARRNGGRVGGWLEDDGVAADDGCGRHAGHDGEGKIPRRDDRADAERNVE